MSSGRRPRRASAAPEEVSFASAKEAALGTHKSQQQSKKSHAETKKQQKLKRQQLQQQAIEEKKKEKEEKKEKKEKEEKKNEGETPKAPTRIALPDDVLEEAENMLMEEDEEADGEGEELDALSPQKRQRSHSFLEPSPVPAKKTRHTVGMFEVVSSGETQFGVVNPKVTQFMNNHFWGERIKRMDIDQFRSEKVAFGPAKNFVES